MLKKEPEIEAIKIRGNKLGVPQPKEFCEKIERSWLCKIASCRRVCCGGARLDKKNCMICRNMK